MHDDDDNNDDDDDDEKKGERKGRRRNEVRPESRLVQLHVKHSIIPPSEEQDGKPASLAALAHDMCMVRGSTSS